MLMLGPGWWPAAAEANCRQVVLMGEVSAGQQWHAALGDGWVFRLMPIAPGQQQYTGWDMVLDREGPEAGYPDALLLGTPPYGSLSEREMGTTYGLRAQDAIAWTPRRFHFLTSARDVERARGLFDRVMSGREQEGAVSRATEELLRLVSDPARMGTGEFGVLDAKLTPGEGDPAKFAEQWASRLPLVPHTNLQAEGKGSARGQLRWIRFRVTLWMPGSWRLLSGMQFTSVTCAK